MKLKTLIKKLEEANSDFKEKYGSEPMIFDLSIDEFDRKIEMTITSKVLKWKYGTMTAKEKRTIKTRY